MEPLIFGLIVMAVGAFFKNKKDDENNDDQKSRTEPPAFGRQSTQAGQMKQSGQRTFKRVEDYAREMYGELQNQMKENPEQTKKVMNKVEKAVDQTPLRDARQNLQNRSSEGRLSAHKNQQAPIPKQAVKNSEDLFPMDANDIQKGIILSEIFMAPKSKRK